MEQDDLKPIPQPVGKFIIEQTDINPCVGMDGSWYHYKDVVTLMRRYKEAELAAMQSKYGFCNTGLERIKAYIISCLKHSIGPDHNTILKLINEALSAGEGEKGAMFSADQVQAMLIEFALAYHKSQNKDIANDAAEYLYDKLNQKEDK
jgi:hypothetical protein